MILLAIIMNSINGLSVAVIIPIILVVAIFIIIMIIIIAIVIVIMMIINGLVHLKKRYFGEFFPLLFRLKLADFYLPQRVFWLLVWLSGEFYEEQANNKSNKNNNNNNHNNQNVEFQIKTEIRDK